MSERENDGQERTESPTPRKRERAREEGKVARSTELPAALGLLAGAVILSAAGGRALAGFSTQMLNESSRRLAGGEMNAGEASAVLRHLVFGLLLALAPSLAAVGAAVLGVNLIQARGVMSWKPLMPKLSNLSPLSGFKRMIGTDALFNLLKSMLKLAALALVSWIVVGRSLPSLISLPDTPTLGVAAVMRDLMLRLGLCTGLAFAAIAAVDYGFRVFRHEQELRMSRQEMRQELRESEGDPLVKARQRSLARSRARQRMLQAVPSADVVIVNPTHIAVALRYDVSVSPAPVVVAMGQRKIAQRIKELALRHGVAVIENKPVARALLAAGRIGLPIPPALYAAVAEILAFVYRQRTRRGEPGLPGRSLS